MRRVLLVAAAVAGLVCAGCQPFTTATTGTAPVTVEQLQPAAAPAGPYQVAYVIDGDTIAVTTDPGAEPVRVRLSGLDSPENTQTVECSGPEATARTTELLATASVWLETDASQGEVDKYGRTLAFVWTGQDGRTLVNAELIAGGFAHEYTYDQPYRYQQQLRARENTARTTGVGLWSADTCDGEP